MNIITPTIGRKVWFFGLPWDVDNRNPGKYPIRIDTNRPMDATIIYVWSDRLVNLVVVDHGGQSWFMPYITLIPPGESMPSTIAHAEWMPYQMVQAKPKEDFLAVRVLPDAVSMSGGIH